MYRWWWTVRSESHSNELTRSFWEISIENAAGRLTPHFCLFLLLRKADGCCFCKHLPTLHRLMLLNKIINSSLAFLLHLWQELNKPAELQNAHTNHHCEFLFSSQHSPLLRNDNNPPLGFAEMSSSGFFGSLWAEKMCGNAKCVFTEKPSDQLRWFKSDEWIPACPSREIQSQFGPF